MNWRTKPPESGISRSVVYKSAVLVLLSSCLLAACRSSPVPAQVQAERWANAWIESFNSHRLAQIGPLMQAKPASYEDPTTGGPRSDQGFDYWFVGMMTRFPAWRFAVHGVHGDDHFVVVEWTLHGVPSPAAESPIEGTFLIDLDGNRIKRVRGYYDPRKLGKAQRQH